MTALERFWTKFEFTPGCWEWKASRTYHGYGQFCFGERKMGRAHRFAYQAMIGPIPAGLELDHTCRNRACVNPDHLEPVTHKENVQRGELWTVSASKTHCPRGHAYDAANTRIWCGKRVCRACRATKTIQRQQAQR